MIGVTNMKMKLIDGRRDERQRNNEILEKWKAARYLRQIVKHTERIVAGGTVERADEKHVVPVFVGSIKFFSFMKGEDLDGETDKDLKELWQMYNAMLTLAACLSPEKIAQLLPPEKVYNGERYSMKDFYTATQAVEQAGGKKRFKDVDEVLGFLMELTNRDVTRCCIFGLRLVSEMRERQGEKSLADEFMEEQTGLPYHIPKWFGEARDKAGRVYITDEYGKLLGLKAKPRRPKWLRKIEGWKE